MAKVRCVNCVHYLRENAPMCKLTGLSRWWDKEYECEKFEPKPKEKRMDAGDYLTKCLLLKKCLDRTEQLLGEFPKFSRVDAAVDLIKSGVDLTRLLSFDDENFLHDICGIAENMNRKTGKLDNGFVPRAGLVEVQND